MSEKKWTPGPWGMTPNWQCPATLKGAMIYSHVEPGINPRIGDVSALSVNSQETCEANANLIAAAPELYDALEYLMSQVANLIERGKINSFDLCDSGLDDDLTTASTALAKARGEK